MITNTDFDAIKISVASPEQIKQWSYGEVVKPETINYRTQKPERGGLFCERIFGPVKDWECSCGKYKKVRYKGIICDKCGVEVTRAIVRRERMGHIELAAPVVHVWFVRGTPNFLALLLNITPRKLERVIYYAQYVITEVDEEARKAALEDMDEQLVDKQKELDEQLVEDKQKLEAALEKELNDLEKKHTARIKKLDGEEKKQAETDCRIETDAQKQNTAREIKKAAKKAERELHDFTKNVNSLKTKLESLTIKQTLSEHNYLVLSEQFPDVFQAGMGAEALVKLIGTIDLPALAKDLQKQIKSTGSKQKKKKYIKRLRVIEAIESSHNDPSWMVLQALPVIPPDLRPMVQLDGGRFAASDLNDLYRRVINRNNRLKRLIELGAPEVIMRNEKRMLQEAVDALIDNSAHAEKVISRRNRKLKSLSDILKGKQGRFRQNLLGKRVDYSGRSVIVVGSKLRLHQCGLPKKMALELFKPFILRELLRRDYVHTIKAANRMIERMQPEVWDVLDEIVVNYPVLLNRAPTLHRLGIQAFFPVLTEGDAIQIHPLVCSAFNADFDGDQMAVHIPLSKQAKDEAAHLMLSARNLLLPASGRAAVGPTRDMLLGCYYLTLNIPGATGEGASFGDPEEAIIASDLEAIDLHAIVKVRMPDTGKLLETTAGRLIFNKIVPEGFPYQNVVMTKKVLGKLIEQCFEVHGIDATALFVDQIKDIGFKYSTISAATIAVGDVQIPETKPSILAKAEAKAELVNEQYQGGLITDNERYEHTVNLWIQTTEEITEEMMKCMDEYSPLSMMITSGARGNIEQMRQMAGMRGLMADPSGRIIDLPIKSNFREGLTVLEYFISTHGARKGRADTALRTADSGYLTRRMVDVSQNVIVYSEDCGTQEGLDIEVHHGTGLDESFFEKVVGRMAAAPVVDPQTGEIIVGRNEEIDERKAEQIVKANVERVRIRYVLACRSHFGICQMCYGRDLSRGGIVALGEPVGIMAAQAIGEPGTQLTMRTFHAGGVAGGIDITQGLPRVEELFEARPPKGEAPIASIDGIVSVVTENILKKIIITALDFEQEDIDILEEDEILVEKNEEIKAGKSVLKRGRQKIKASLDGIVKVGKKKLTIVAKDKKALSYTVPKNARLRVEEGQLVSRGTQLIEGSINLKDLLLVCGVEAVQRYLVSEVQKIYRSQGVTTNDKHIEIIVRRMLARVKIIESGDSDFLPGDLVNRFKIDRVNAELEAAGKMTAKVQPVILGITKAALNSGSFLSAASFQETIRVLTKASLYGAEDRLVGLKENLIIGKLIPAGPYARKDIERKTIALS